MQRTSKYSEMKLLLISLFILMKKSETAITGWTVPTIIKADGSGTVTTPLVPENLAEGKHTGISITATSGASAAVSYVLLSQQKQGMFTIDRSNGTVTFAKGELDFETTPTYWIQVTASDTTVTNGTANITLNVGNSPPVFKPTTYSKEVCDGAKVGTTVETVKAEDPGNTKVTYALSGVTNFTIGSTTGVIKVDTAKTLNMTVTKSYNLTVTATDTVTPTAGVGTATVSVIVKVCSGGTSAIAIAYGALLLSIIVNRL